MHVHPSSVDKSPPVRIGATAEVHIRSAGTRTRQTSRSADPPSTDSALAFTGNDTRCQRACNAIHLGTFDVVKGNVI
jgi:hypothetical protein